MSGLQDAAVAMWIKLRVAFAGPKLRLTILLALLLLAIYRVGWHMPLPIVNPAAPSDMAAGQK